MSKRTSANSDSVRRAQAAQLKKPFPWGAVAGGTAVAVALGAILFYAATNVGSSAPSPLRDADAKFSDLVKPDVKTLTRNHKPGVLTYSTTPPVGGDHAPVWQNCAVYAAEIPKEQALHSLEHGAVWITYRPDLPADQVKVLSDLVTGNPYALLSPFPGLTKPVTAQAWGRQLQFDSVEDDDIETFLDTYADGPQRPERAACSGGVSTTGSVPISAS